VVAAEAPTHEEVKFPNTHLPVQDLSVLPAPDIEHRKTVEPY